MGCGHGPAGSRTERGACGEGWGRTRCRPRRILFPTGPGILGAKAKGGGEEVIKEGRGSGGREGGRETSPRPIPETAGPGAPAGALVLAAPPPPPAPPRL